MPAGSVNPNTSGQSSAFGLNIKVVDTDGGRAGQGVGRVRAWRVALFALVLTLPLVPQPAAHALTIYHFRGTVTDPLDRPLAGATVTDGFQTSTTDVDGAYEIPESSPGTFTLRASRSHSASSSREVTVLLPADTEVNFTLKYLIRGSLPSPEISTADGPVIQTLTITNWAPADQSCVKVTDSRTNTTSSATYQGTDTDGSSLWTFELSLEQAAPEGLYTLTDWAEDCDSGLRLTISDNVYYLIDNTPPSPPQSEAACGGEIGLRPEHQTCVTTFVLSSPSVGSGVTPPADFVGVLRAWMTTSSGSVRWVCRDGFVAGGCSSSTRGSFAAGQTMTIRGDIRGSSLSDGRWEVRAEA